MALKNTSLKPAQISTGSVSPGGPPKDPNIFEKFNQLKNKLLNSIKSNNTFQRKRGRFIDTITQVFLASGADFQDISDLFSWGWEFARDDDHSFLGYFSRDHAPDDYKSIKFPLTWLYHSARVLFEETKGENLTTWIKKNPEKASDLLITAMTFCLKSGKAYTPDRIISPLQNIEASIQKTKTLSGKKLVRSHKDFGKHFQYHHVISDKYSGTKKHALWDLAGIKPNSNINKILLPTKIGSKVGGNKRSIHYGRHLKSVGDKLAKKMDLAKEKGDRMGWTKTQYADALKKIINKEKVDLKSGTRILNKHHRPWGVPD